eukprot:3182028-Pyramimonas_sp.AAC.1
MLNVRSLIDDLTSAEVAAPARSCIQLALFAPALSSMLGKLGFDVVDGTLESSAPLGCRKGRRLSQCFGGRCGARPPGLQSQDALQVPAE